MTSDLRIAPRGRLRLLTAGRAFRALGRQWHWLVAGAAFGAFAGFAGWQAQVRHRAGVELTLQGPGVALDTGTGSGSGDGLTARSLEEAARYVLSPEVVQRTVRRLGGLESLEQFLERAEVQCRRDHASIQLCVEAKFRSEAVREANAWAEEALGALRARGTEGSTVVRQTLREGLDQADRELASVGSQLTKLQGESIAGLNLTNPFARLGRLGELSQKASTLRRQIETVDLQVRNLESEIQHFTPALVAARDELNRALLRYTEQHPKVRELRASVAELEATARDLGTNAQEVVGNSTNSPAAALYAQLVSLRNERLAFSKELEGMVAEQQHLQEGVASSPVQSARVAELQTRYDVLLRDRQALVARMQDLQSPLSLGNVAFALGGPVRLSEARGSVELRRIAFPAGGAGLAGLGVTGLLVMLADFKRKRIYTVRELEGVSALPVLAQLDDLRVMAEDERERWAARTFTRIKGRLTADNKQALVCGFVSANRREGRSTFIRLVSGAAARQGYRVFVVSADGNGGGERSGETEPGPAASYSVPEPSQLPVQISRALEGRGTLIDALELPRQEWTLERRDQWRLALAQSGTVENLILFIELPPAFETEALLLAESIPNLVWVCGKAMSNAVETRTHLETFTDARSRFVGCVMNTVPTALRKTRANPAGAMVLAALLTALPLAAQQPPPTPQPPALAAKPETAGALSLSGPSQLADWQKRLSLGPGDVVDISLHGERETLRTGLTIGPDGRLNYLEARDVPAAGLTVDELRTKLEDILSKFHRAPRVIVLPIAYNSKKYYLLGAVTGRGMYTLDRPTTVIEAVAKARGFASTVASRAALGSAQVVPPDSRSPLMPVDFSRSFLVRRNAAGAFARMPVDFEALFLRGELTQNAALAPDDYLFFAPLDLQEVYVLGEVRAPGILNYSPDLSVLAAIVARGGLTDRAYKGRILVVRGSLNRPVPFIVNLNDILTAKAGDFPLSNRDIVYVARRPFQKVEELLEMAALDFTRSFVIGWAGQHVGPFITEPIVK